MSGYTVKRGLQLPGFSTEVSTILEKGLFPAPSIGKRVPQRRSPEIPDGTYGPGQSLLG